MCADQNQTTGLDITKPVSIFDDRSKIDSTLIVKEVLWIDGSHALVRVTMVSRGDADFQLDGDPDQPILIDFKSKRVLNSDFDSWLIQNIKPGGQS